MSGRTDPNQLTKALHTVTVVKRVAQHLGAGSAYKPDEAPQLLRDTLAILGYDYSRSALMMEKANDPTIAACLEACKRIVKGEGK